MFDQDATAVGRVGGPAGVPGALQAVDQPRGGAGGEPGAFGEGARGERAGRKFLRGTTLADEITDVRFIGPDTAIVTSRGDVRKPGRGGSLGKVQTYVLVREPDDAWRIAAFQNTKHRSLAEAVSFRFAPDLRPTAAIPS